MEVIIQPTAETATSIAVRLLAGVIRKKSKLDRQNATSVCA